MTKSEIQALAICAVLTVAVVIGSTGFGYADYRPLRNYDIFAIAISWIGLLFHVWRGRRTS